MEKNSAINGVLICLLSLLFGFFGVTEAKTDSCYYVGNAAYSGIDYDRKSFEPYEIRRDFSVLNYFLGGNETRVHYMDSAFVFPLSTYLVFFCASLMCCVIAFAIGFLTVLLLNRVFPGFIRRFKIYVCAVIACLIFRFCLLMVAFSFVRYHFTRDTRDLAAARFLLRHEEFRHALDDVSEYFDVDLTLTKEWSCAVGAAGIDDFTFAGYLARAALYRPLYECMYNLRLFVQKKLIGIELNPGPTEGEGLPIPSIPELLARFNFTRRTFTPLEVTTVEALRAPIRPPSPMVMPGLVRTVSWDDINYDEDMPLSPPRLVRQNAEDEEMPDLVSEEEFEIIDTVDDVMPPFIPGATFREIYCLRITCACSCGCGETSIFEHWGLKYLFPDGFELFRIMGRVPFYYHDRDFIDQTKEISFLFPRSPYWPRHSISYFDIPFQVIEDDSHPLSGFMDICAHGDDAHFIEYKLMSIEPNPGPRHSYCYEFVWNDMVGEILYECRVFAWQDVDFFSRTRGDDLDAMFSMSKITYMDANAQVLYTEEVPFLQVIERDAFLDFRELPFTNCFMVTLLERFSVGALTGHIMYRLLTIEKNPGPTWSEVLQSPAPKYVNLPVESTDIIYDTSTVKDFKKKMDFKYMSKLRRRIQKFEKTASKEHRRVMRQTREILEKSMREVYHEQMESLDFIKGVLAPRIEISHGAALERGIDNVAHAVNSLRGGVPFIHTIPVLDKAFDSFNSFLSDDSLVPIVIMLLVTLFSWYSHRHRSNSLSVMLCSVGIAYCAYKFGASDKTTLACMAIAGYYHVVVKDYSSEEVPYYDQALVWDETMQDSLLMTMMGAAFGLIYRRHTTDTTFLPFLKELGDLPKIEKGVKMSFDYILKVLSRFSSWCATTFDTEGFLVVEGELPIVDEIVNEALNLIKEFRDPDFRFNQLNGQRIIDLQCRIDKLANVELKKTGHVFAEARKILFNLTNKLKPVLTKFESLGRAKDSTRMVPDVYAFLGPPGVGKTFVIKQLSEFVIAMTLPAHREKNFAEAPGNELWYVSPDTNFDGDGYNYQWAFVIDEFLAATEVEGGQDNNLVRAFLQWVSDHPKRLNRAELTEKDDTYFQCRFGIVTTNVFPWTKIKSIVNLEALARRVHAFYVVPKAEFCREGTAEGDLTLRRLDKNKLPPYVAGEKPTDILEFYGCNVLAHTNEERFVGGIKTTEQIGEFMVANYRLRVDEYDKSVGLRSHARYAAFRRKYEEAGLPLPEYLDQAGGWSEYFTSMFFPSPDEEEEDELEATSPVPTFGDFPPDHVFGKVDAAEAEFIMEVDSFSDWLKLAAEKWWARPENKRLTAFVALCGSATLLWYFTRSQFKEQSGEARMKNIARSRPNRKPQKTFGEQSGEFGGNTMALAFSLYRRNIVRFQNRSGESLGHVLMIRGRVGVMPKHYMTVISRCLVENPSMIVSLQPYGRVVPQECLLREILFDIDPKNDRMKVLFPKVLPEFHDITQHFANQDDSHFETWNFIAGIVTDNSLIDSRFDGVLYYPVTCTSRGCAYNAEGQCYGDGFHCDGGTFEGMCGLPYMTKVGSRPQIFAMHVAGSADGSCYGVALFREYVESISRDEPSSTVLEIVEPSKYFDQCGLPSQFIVCGKADFVNQPSRSAHVPSILMGAWGPSKMTNSLLRDKVVDGVLIQPRLRAMGNYSANTKGVSLDLATCVMESYWARVVNRSKSPALRRLVEYEEAVVGIPGLTNGISMSSSMGYPYASRNISKENVWGPRHLPKDLARPQAKEIERDVYLMIDKMKKRQKPFVPFTDNVKSEKVKIEKVNIKSRIFTYPPVVFLIVCKMYMDGFCQWCEKNMIANGLTIGVNPYSVHWTFIATTLLSVGNNMIDGDFGAYDASLLCVWFYLYFEMVKRFYRTVYTEEQMNVLDMICEVIVSSIHIYPAEFGCVFYEWFGSMSSGVLFTGNGNSMIGQMVLRYAMVDILTDGKALDFTYKTVFDFVEFELNFEAVTNGDDNVLSVSDLYKEKIDQMSMADSLLKIGMRYTDAQKSGVMIAHRPITEVQFLKRMFVWDDINCRWIAPLEMLSIVEAPYWKTRSAGVNDLAQTVEQSLSELSLHGRTIYEPVCALIIDACVQRDIPIPARQSWESVYSKTLTMEAFY